MFRSSDRIENVLETKSLNSVKIIDIIWNYTLFLFEKTTFPIFFCLVENKTVLQKILRNFR